MGRERRGRWMIIAAIFAIALALIALDPAPALAWGPVTHIVLGVQTLASISDGAPVYAALANLPEVFLYGGLAPDIVQGRRLQSRLRRHSHNWTTGTGLLDAARGDREQAFALGYLAHLAADVVAHNYYLPARFVGYFRHGIGSHILEEARFDGLHPADYRELLLRLLNLDFKPLDRMLKRAVDSPLVGFRAHRMIFDGGLRRIREWHRALSAVGAAAGVPAREAELFLAASADAIDEVLAAHGAARCCRYDPMGAAAIAGAADSRRNLQKLMRLGGQAESAADALADSMLADLLAHLERNPFDQNNR